MCPRGLSKHIETKLKATCFNLTQSFFKKQKRPLSVSIHKIFETNSSCHENSVLWEKFNLGF